jgi:hypothetical protein
MISCVHDLSIPVPLFKEHIDPFMFPKVRHTRLHAETLNDSLLELFNKLNLEINLVEVFYSRPFFESGIHIDSSGGDINKINWVFGGAGCKMNWYSVDHQHPTKEIKNTVIGTDYLPFDKKEVILEHSKILHSPSLVHVGIPHNVHNLHQDRWCVSLVYQFKGTKIRPTMNQSLKIFQEFLQSR